MKGLENKVIISTRPLSQDDSMINYLTQQGAIVNEFPMIEISQAEIDDNISETLEQIDSFNWIIFTSKNGVKYFFNILKKLDLSITSENIKFALIGNVTSEELLKNGFKPHFVSSGNTSEYLLNELSNGMIGINDNILLCLGNLATTTLEDGLSAIAMVTRINVYDTNEPKNISKEIISKIKEDKYDIIIFTSPSGFSNFLRVMKKNDCSGEYRITCIGKTTEKEILKHKHKPLFISTKSDGINFAKEIEKYFS